MKRFIWRNRASAILGLLVVIVAIFNGPYGWLRSTILVVLGLLIAIFGFARTNQLAHIEQDAVGDKNDNSEKNG